MSFELLHPWAIAIFIVFVALKIFLKQESEATYFSQVELLQKVFKKQSSLALSIEFLVVLLLSLALSFPTQKVEKTFTPLSSKEALFLLNLRKENSKELALKSLEKVEPSRVALSAILGSFHKIVPLTPDIDSTKKIIQNLKLIDNTKADIFSSMTASISLAHPENTTLFLVGFNEQNIKKELDKLHKFMPELQVYLISTKEDLKKLSPLQKSSDLTVIEKRPLFLYPLFAGLSLLLLYIYLQNRIRKYA